MTSSNRLRAVVRVVMDVEADSVWGGDTTFDQVAKQAQDGVEGLLTNGNILCLKDLHRRIKSLEVIEVRVIKEQKT